MYFSDKLDEIQGEIDGIQVSAKELAIVTEESPQHFIVKVGNETKEIFLTQSGLLSDGNSLDRIEVKTYSQRKRIINERFKENKTINEVSAEKGAILKAPMPGMVRTISVSIGDKVSKDTQVLVLEAMKMENSISAGFIGIVTKILIETGTSVEKNQQLLEFRRS